MLRTHYSTRPTAMDMNAFTLIYRWDIREFQMPTDNGEPYVDYSAYVVRINAPFSQNKLIEAVMTAQYGNDFENKLINEYNAAMMDIYTDPDEKAAKIQRYTDFLRDRAALKADIERVCIENGIVE